MSDTTVAEKIANNTFLVAVGRVVTVTLPILVLPALGYIGGMATMLADHETRLAIIEQKQADSDKFEDRTDRKLNELNATQTSILSSLATLIERTAPRSER